MADALGFTFMTGVLGMAYAQLSRWLTHRRSEDAATQDRIERRRLRACEAVLRSFRSELGFLLADALSPSELTELIAAQPGPKKLLSTLIEHCQAIEGVVLGTHPIGQALVPVTLSTARRARHLLIEGKSGMGKTTLIRNCVLADLLAGRGIGVLGPEHELFETEILPYIPENRWDDVIYVNPADTKSPIPFNPLHLEEGEDLDLKLDETFTIFRRIFDDEGTGAAPRTDTILRKGLSVLMQVGGTLLDFERLLDRRDGAYREWVLSQIPDERTRYFWRSVYSNYPKDAHLPLVNRLDRFLQPKCIRAMLCQTGGSLNVRQAMDQGKVLLFNLSDGLLGEANAQLLGQLIVAKVQTAAMSRANLAPGMRRPFYFWVDEFQNFVGSSGTSYRSLLQRSRKYMVYLALAHQQLGQIPADTLRELFGNVSTLISFRVGATDARKLAQEFVGEIDGQPATLDPKELLSLGIGEAWMRTERNVFLLKTPPPLPHGSTRTRTAVIARSRERHGAPAVRRPAPAQMPRTNQALEGLDPRDVF